MKILCASRNITHNCIKPIPKPNCRNCVYFKNQNSTEWETIGVCKLFKHTYTQDSNNYYVEVDYCRTLPDLCGPEGKYYKLSIPDLNNINLITNDESF